MAMLAMAVVAAIPALADTEYKTAVPGTMNYVEGQVSIGSESLTSKSIGYRELAAGQSLSTDNGKAEMLLTPGVFLRLGNNSSAQMVSSSLTNTRVALSAGEAMVEVDQIHAQNDIQIQQGRATTHLLKTGLYDFDSNQHLVRVIEGKAVVQENDHEVTVKGGHELALRNDNAKQKAQKFDKKNFEATDLYRWSSLRSDYLAQANVNAARTYYVNGWYGPGWIGSGWYWDPWFSAFTFIPGEGIFYNPFGWDFYSPLVVYQSPLFLSGFHGARFADPPARVAHAPSAIHNRAVHVSPRAGMSARGFSGGTHSMGAVRTVPSGGFHGNGFGNHR